jgi:hypothetical protein
MPNVTIEVRKRYTRKMDLGAFDIPADHIKVLLRESAAEIDLGFKVDV